MGEYGILCVIGLALVTSGYFIWIKKKHFVIAGFRDGKWYGKEVDERKLARRMGIYQICSGVVLFVATLSFLWTGPYFGMLCTLFALGVAFVNLRRIKEEDLD
jgi:hypothetical protein